MRFLFVDWGCNTTLTRLALVTYRFGHWVFYDVGIPVVRRLLWVVYRLLDLVFVKIACGADIPASCHIGPRLALKHGGNGVVLHDYAVIGSDVTMFHQVTIGANLPARPGRVVGAPKIGDRVFIGAGAKILGPVTLGDGCVIGANAVVLTDVPPGATAVGVPARVIPAPATLSTVPGIERQGAS